MRAKIFAFVIMENHIHLIWQMMPDNDPEAVQRDFLKYTAQRIKKDLLKFHPEVLAHFKVDANDREYPRLTGRAGVLEKKCIKCGIAKSSRLFTKARLYSLEPRESRNL